MEKEFIPYNEALELKLLGFDINCFGYYDHTGELFFNTNSQPVGKDWVWKGNELLPTDMVLAPTFSQVFRWFREKYRLHTYIEGAYPWFRYYVNSEDTTWEGFKHLKYEEAELNCLRKLIEIVKTK